MLRALRSPIRIEKETGCLQEMCPGGNTPVAVICNISKFQ